MKTTLKTREDIIAVVEGEDFFKLMDYTKVVAQIDKGYVPKTNITGTPYIEIDSKGRTFGIEAEGFGKVEIYSHKYNNLTNPAVSMVVFPFV